MGRKTRAPRRTPKRPPHARRKSVANLRRQPGIDAIPDLRVKAVAHGHVVEQRAERIDELALLVLGVLHLTLAAAEFLADGE